MAQKIKTVKSDDIKTPMFKASFPYCINGTESDQVDEKTGKKRIKYELTCLFPKATTDLKVLRAAYEKVAREAFGDTVSLAHLSNPIKDGDTPNTIGVVIEANKGHWVMRTHTYFKPKVYLYNQHTVAEDPASVKPGDQMKAIIRFESFAMPTKRGVSCILQTAIKLADGNGLPGVTGGRDYGSAFADDVQAVGGDLF